MPELQTQVALDVKGLSAFYGPAQALFDVSLQVRQGEFVVLQGLNGAGKSTLLRALMGLEVRSKGCLTTRQKPGAKTLPAGKPIAARGPAWGMWPKTADFLPA